MGTFKIYSFSNFQILLFDTVLLTIITMLYITFPGFILNLCSYSRHLHKPTYGELGQNGRPIQEFPKSWQNTWVSVDSDERWGLKTQCCKVYVSWVRQTVGVSEARWEPRWQKRAPGCLEPHWIAVKGPWQSTRSWETIFFSDSLLWRSNQIGLPIRCALGAVCSLGTRLQNILMGVVSILLSSWLECDLYQQTDGPSQGYSSEEMAGAWVVTIWGKRKKRQSRVKLLRGEINVKQGPGGAEAAM